MKLKILILMLMTTTVVSAQSFDLSPAAINVDLISGLESQLIDFKLIELKAEVDEKSVLQKKTVQLILPEILTTGVRYAEANLLSPAYIATVSSDKGVELISSPRPSNFILYDTDTDKQIGRLNFRGQKLSGMFFIDRQNYFIRPVSDFVSGADAKQYVLYHSNSNEETAQALCEAHKMMHDEVKNKPSSSSSTKVLNACYVIEVATEADYELYQKYGSDAGATLQHVLDQFNLVEGIYQSSDVDLSFAIVYQNVWTTSSDPYVEGERFAMRNEFKAVWNDPVNGFTDIDRDVAYMVSGKVGTNGGAAFTSTAGDPENAYAVGQEFDSDTDQHLIAHEIGHTLSASHDTGDDCTDDKPTSGTMCSFVGTMGFSTNSVSEISTYLDDNSVLFSHSADLSIIFFDQITGIRSIVATSDLTITATIISPGYVRAIAGETITLPPGFSAQPGAFFNGSINATMNVCD